MSDRDVDLVGERETWLKEQIDKHTNHIVFLEHEIEINTWLIERMKKELQNVKT